LAIKAPKNREGNLIKTLSGRRGREGGGVDFKGWEEQPDFEEKNDYHFGWLLFLHLHETVCALKGVFKKRSVLLLLKNA
jgi:hypothetical protein